MFGRLPGQHSGRKAYPLGIRREGATFSLVDSHKIILCWQQAGAVVDVTFDFVKGSDNWLGISANKLCFRIESLPMTRSMGEDFKTVAMILIGTYLFKSSEK